MMKERTRSIILGPPYNINLGKPSYSTGVTLYACLSSLINNDILLVFLKRFIKGKYISRLRDTLYFGGQQLWGFL
jgi:hypothetical protein